MLFVSSPVDLEKQNKIAVVARIALWLMELVKDCLDQEKAGKERTEISEPFSTFAFNISLLRD